MEAKIRQYRSDFPGQMTKETWVEATEAGLAQWEKYAIKNNGQSLVTPKRQLTTRVRQEASPILQAGHATPNSTDTLQ